MGGCCCCFPNHVEWNDQSRLHHFPVVSEESQPLSSRSGTVSAFPTGLLVDTNLDTSVPDIYRHPPSPIPYDANAGNPQSPLNNRQGSGNKRNVPVQANNSEPVGEIRSNNSGDNGAKETKEANGKEQTNNEPVATEVDVELEKSGEIKKSRTPFVAPEECPTCLEEYDEENPKIVTKCEHHFHLSCILEWMERSDTCPVCDQEMVLDFPIDD